MTVTLKHVGMLAANVMGHNWVLAKTARLPSDCPSGSKRPDRPTSLPAGDARIIAATPIDRRRPADIREVRHLQAHARRRLHVLLLVPRPFCADEREVHHRVRYGGPAVAGLCRIAQRQWPDPRPKTRRCCGMLALAVVIVLLVIGSLIFHFASPWYFTPLASNWGTVDFTVNVTFWVVRHRVRRHQFVHRLLRVAVPSSQRQQGALRAGEHKARDHTDSRSRASASPRC